MSSSSSDIIHVPSLANFKIGVKDGQPEKDAGVKERMRRFRSNYEQLGLRRSVDAVILVHQHRTVHVLLLQIGTAYFKLPGGRLRPGEDEIEGLRRKLTHKILPDDATDFRWDIGDCIGTWWRPNFENHLLPYIPTHITKPKECKKLYLVLLPESCLLSVPKNMKILAVPIFSIFENSSRYGTLIGGIPPMLSRYSMVLVDSQTGTASTSDETTVQEDSAVKSDTEQSNFDDSRSVASNESDEFYG